MRRRGQAFGMAPWAQTRQSKGESCIDGPTSRFSIAGHVCLERVTMGFQFSIRKSTLRDEVCHGRHRIRRTAVGGFWGEANRLYAMQECLALSRRACPEPAKKKAATRLHGTAKMVFFFYPPSPDRRATCVPVARTRFGMYLPLGTQGSGWHLAVWSLEAAQRERAIAPGGESSIAVDWTSAHCSSTNPNAGADYTGQMTGSDVPSFFSSDKTSFSRAQRASLDLPIQKPGRPRMRGVPGRRWAWDSMEN